MTYKVTHFKSERTKKGGTVLSFDTFDELARSFSEAEEGIKFGSGFVRGELDPPVRLDENGSVSNLLIIDGDEGKNGRPAPRPYDVSEALKDLGYNHFIYTSHSHNPADKKNKYRVVIDSEEYNKAELDNNNKAILAELSTRGINIKYVKEMKAWSQIWFEPRADNIEVFEYYKHTAGKQWRVKHVEEAASESAAPEAESQEDVNTETLGEMYENIRTGKEYHTSLRTISYQLVQDGMSKAHTKAMLTMLMNASVEAGSERWQTRYDDIYRLVDGVTEKEESMEFKVGADKEASVYSPPPKPPGMMGKFIDETKEFMLYEDETIAFVSSMFILCSIAGRKFNVDIHNAQGMAKPTALNMYFTLAAETGVGKSEIEDAVENCYNQFAGSTGAVQDFFYKGRVTGPRALYARYKDQRSLGIIANEAGMEGQSKLGDSQGLRSAWLNLYGQGAWKKWTGASELSDSDSSIKSVRAVAISRVSESTPVELSAYYRQGSSVENGLIPRENIFVIKELNENPNENIRLVYSNDIIHRMEKLVAKCHIDVGEDALFKPFIISVDDKSILADMINTQKHYRHLQNKGTSLHERAMAGRMFVKMLRYVGLITVINKDSDDPRALVIDREHWEWAKSVVKDEYSKISDVVALTSGNDVMDAAVEHVATKFGQMLSGTIKNNDGKLDPMSRRKGIAPTSKLKKVCKSCMFFKELEGDPKYTTNYKSGWDKTIDYMVKLKYIELLEKNPLGRGTAIQAKPELMNFLESLDV
jgi:signal recognition particle subunit SEC65